MALEDNIQFDFLPQLPKSNLDDRTFDDLVAECILRIPRYCPEWTDYNPSDPGITLVELFAWLTDQMLLRFNQIPLRNYITFLELLGIRLQPSTPAQTDITFYITQPDHFPYRIAEATEVGTERTETEEAIVFITDQDLLIGQPSLSYFIVAPNTDTTDVTWLENILDNNRWTRQNDGSWAGHEQPLFDENPQLNNCFYLVFDPEEPVEGNVLAVTFKGRAATPTGINPDFPPRQWQAWNGKAWVNVLLQEADDYTRGFSFAPMNEQTRDATVAGDVILHLPQNWPSTTIISNYTGRWLRCVYQTSQPVPGYSRPPLINGLTVRSIGGTITASHCSIVKNEVLGVSDGTSGQKFRLSSTPILERREEEHILVIPEGASPQSWQEVKNFANSNNQDPHYTLDSLTGVVQFGPRIEEPSYLSQKTKIRANLANLPLLENYSTGGIMSNEVEGERQYGSIPPRGAEIRMRSYRIGGGRKGNVKKGALRILKSSLPYVTSVINYSPASGGSDSESLQQAVLRVPNMLRNRDRAVTKEDFESLTIEGGAGRVCRALCLAQTSSENANNQPPGTVTILVVKTPNIQEIDYTQGISPELFELDSHLENALLEYLNQRKLLGVQVRLAQPEYIGVRVEAQVALLPEYNNPEAQEQIRKQLEITLYRFLNPITGGNHGRGWPFGRSLYLSDLIALLQQKPEISFLGQVLLYEITKNGNEWQRRPELPQSINPGPQGLICSWVEFGHLIRFMN